MSMATFLTVLIVIYLRVSTEDQKKKGFSIPEQREQCRAKAQELVRELEAELGHEVQLTIEEFEDTFGGDIEVRPVLEQVRAFVRANRPRYFVCLSPDRFSRDLELQLRVTKEIRAIGTGLEFVDYQFRDDAEGMLQYQVRGAVSEYEKKSILRRTYRGIVRKVKEGKRSNGAAPYGYRHNHLTDQLEIYEPEAMWIRRMFEWVATEHIGATTVAERLTAAGVPTKRGAHRWYRGVVAEMLHNTSYVGQMRCLRKDMRGMGAVRRLPRGKRPDVKVRVRPESEWQLVPVPAIISRDLFDQVQANFTRNRRGGRRDTGLLSMIVRCGVCGGAMGYAHQASTGKYHIRCQRRYAHRLSYKDPTRCTNKFHRAQVVEDYVWNKIVTWLTKPDLLEEYLVERSQGDDLAEQIGRLQEEQRLIEKQLAERFRMQTITIQSVAQGVLTQSAANVTLAEVSLQVSRLENEQARVSERLISLQERHAATATVIDRFKTIRDQVAEETDITRAQLERLGKDNRRRLVLDLVRSVTIYQNGTVDVDPRDD
ncbi:MAG TPA: recombinase family protein [Symbiobacteriaceae bacterium]|nr:recombinase family protein [Symbiobacteriaceae bacterium]